MRATLPLLLAVAAAFGSIPPPAAAQSPTNCVLLTNGLVGWWPAENNALDSSGLGHHGTLLGEAGFTDGIVGPAFAFRHTDTPAGVRIAATPALDVGTGEGFTLEAWILPRTLARRGPILEWNNSRTNEVTPWGVHLVILEPQEHDLGAGNLVGNAWDTNGLGRMVMAPGGTLTNGGFQHVALTFERPNGRCRLYCNGRLVAEAEFGPFTPLTSYDLFIGRRPAGDLSNPYSFDGAIDEAAVYRRALSPDEIQSIHQAGRGGRCVNRPVPVSIRCSQVELCWPSRVGFNYQVEYRTNPGAGAWLPLGTPRPGDGQTNCLTDPIPSDAPRRFYRVTEVSPSPP